MYRGNVYTIKRTAEILGVTADDVLELIENGELDYIWKPAYKRYEVRVIPDYEIEHYLETIGRPKKDVERTVQPMRVRIEMTLEPDDRYDEDAAAFMREMSNRYTQIKIDDLY
jgi:hypothetical protein